MELPQDAKQRLAILGQRCAQGMSPLLEAPHRIDLMGEAIWSLPSIPPGACFRVITSHPGNQKLSLLDPQKSELVEDAGADFTLIPLDGPLCLRKTEQLSLRLQGQGETWIQIWSVSP